MDTHRSIAPKHILLGGAVKSLIIFLSALTFGMSLAAQKQDMAPPGEVKKWNFPVKDGELVITLSSFIGSSGTRNALSLTTLGAGAAPTVIDESRDLQRVVVEMPSLGYNPLSIDSIHMGILEPETLTRLQLAAANSEEWRDCLRMKTCGGTRIALQLLQGLGVYDKFNDDLSKYGLTVKLTFLEDMLARPVLDPRDHTIRPHRSKLILPVAGLLEFSVMSGPASH